jgi:hypothetical protein
MNSRRLIEPPEETRSLALCDGAASEKWHTAGLKR